MWTVVGAAAFVPVELAHPQTQATIRAAVAAANKFVLRI
jgi:hypothetical protein